MVEKDYVRLIEKIVWMGHDVMDWESIFLNSVVEQIKTGRGLTKKQRHILDRMEIRYRRYLGEELVEK